MNNEEELKFEKFIQDLEEKMQDPNYREGVSFSLPQNPTLTEKLKFDLCQKLIIYEREEKINLEEFCQRTKISEELANEMLYYHLDYFSLDQIVEAASNVLNLKLEITYKKI